jgi:hypothetical protein
MSARFVWLRIGHICLYLHIYIKYIYIYNPKRPARSLEETEWLESNMVNAPPGNHQPIALWFNLRHVPEADLRKTECNRIQQSQWERRVRLRKGWQVTRERESKSGNHIHGQSTEQTSKFGQVHTFVSLCFDVVCTLGPIDTIGSCVIEEMSGTWEAENGYYGWVLT